MPGLYANAQMSSKQLREICVINQAGEALWKRAMERLNLSARAYDHILKVSRTIADLAGAKDIKAENRAEAIQYWSLDSEGCAGQTFLSKLKAQCIKIHFYFRYKFAHAIYCSAMR